MIGNGPWKIDVTDIYETEEYKYLVPNGGLEEYNYVQMVVYKSISI